MSHRIANAYGALWVPLYPLWIRLARDCAHVGVSDSQKALTNFLGVHRELLVSLGVIAKAANRSWLGHKDHFAPAAFALLIGHDPEEAIRQQKAMLANRARRRVEVIE